MSSHADMLIWRDPPSDLSNYVRGFVYRDERVDGQAVRLLPEVRASIQVMAADAYWLREKTPGAAWRPVPQVALWAPRHTWGYGFVKQHVRAYATALTGAGMLMLTGVSASGLVDQVRPLRDHDATLAASLVPSPSEPFESWIERAVAAMRTTFAHRPQVCDPTRGTLDLLARAERQTVALAARAAGLSERQYRRVFRYLHGTTPKHYQRIWRVDRMLRELLTHPWEGDRHAAYVIAFSDQPHAIREFRALTGLTPGQYATAKRAGDLTLRSVPMPGVEPPLDRAMSQPSSARP